MTLEPLTVLITGASVGIGRALARQFASDGHHVVLIARRERALAELAQELTAQYRITARVIAADLADPAGPQRVFDELRASGVAIDVVVNNAGFGANGAVADLPLDRQLQIVQVNVSALTALTRLFLPQMLERRRGGILNVGSTAGFQPGPLMAVYYATKAYVLSFTEALAEEVEGSGLRVSCLAPGPTETEFAAAAEMTTSRLFAQKGMHVDEVARIGYEGWKAGKVLVIAGRRNAIAAFAAQRIAPRRMIRRFTKALNSSR